MDSLEIDQSHLPQESFVGTERFAASICLFVGPNVPRVEWNESVSEYQVEAIESAATDKAARNQDELRRQHDVILQHVHVPCAWHCGRD
jgi:hypothetical protein